ncbi:uncharacterized protein PAC_00283 [Phialocephala subalpina]|uniref:Uncharacterized protein n=1 Tax=Phialocephala subalpina TaxID=576137 RepID=A0A1L7WCA5_9HELO|nr:uncharacterized protein PAC_00283 [Phialocephala subalpina]
MPFQVSPDKMKPIQTNALLDKVCAFSSYLSGFLLLYSMATFSPEFSHSYLVKLLYAILHLVHLWSSQTILRWNRYVFIHTTNTEFSMLGFKATVLLNNFVAFTSIYLIARAYVQDLPPFPAVGIIGSYLVTHIAINICMDRPSRPMTRHFLVYDPVDDRYGVSCRNGLLGGCDCREIGRKGTSDGHEGHVEEKLNNISVTTLNLA